MQACADSYEIIRISHEQQYLNNGSKSVRNKHSCLKLRDAYLEVTLECLAEIVRMTRKYLTIDLVFLVAAAYGESANSGSVRHFDDISKKRGVFAEAAIAYSVDGSCDGRERRGLVKYCSLNSAVWKKPVYSLACMQTATPTNRKGR